jgi:ubiquitin carboxyl-terminal hydrolase 8
MNKPGGTIADRLKSLQENGLSGATSKRVSRTLHELSPPNSPTRLSSPSLKPSALASSAPVSSSPSPHTFVPPSSLGPPSPSSTPTSSPQLNSFNLSEFTQAFPSIEELDENLAFSLPSVPTGKIPAPDNQPTQDFRNGEPSAPSPHKNFAVSIERPSSTPITPVVNTFVSRPGSPTKPPIPHKPNGLAGSSLPTPSRSPNGKFILPVTDKVSPKDLFTYLRDYNVLLLDVRQRADFEREHIQHGAIACIEPSMLARREYVSWLLFISRINVRTARPLIGWRNGFHPESEPVSSTVTNLIWWLSMTRHPRLSVRVTLRCQFSRV